MALLSVCPAHTDQGSPLCPCEFPSSKGTAGSPTLSLFHPPPQLQQQQPELQGLQHIWAELCKTQTH